MNHVQPVSLLEIDPEHVQGLSPQLRRAARFVIENSGTVATRSQRHVAEVAQLPAPTFTRLARAFGLGSYDQLRDLCRADVLKDSSTILADRAQASIDATDNGDAPLLVDHMEATVRNVQTLLDRIDESQLKDAAKLLATSKRVVLIGDMSARGLVDYVSYVANMSLTGWKPVGRDGQSLASELVDLGPQDACIALSMRPYSRRAVEMTQHVANCGVPIIAFSDNVMSPLATKAKYCLFVGAESPLFFPSHVLPMVVLETLVDMVVRERGAQTQQHIAAVERQNHKLNEYWQDQPATNSGE